MDQPQAQSTPTLFVTGTDTGVGKTFVTTALLHHLATRGLTVSAAKPIETGCEFGTDGELVPADGAKLWKAANAKQSLADVCPFPFSAALAPALAIRASGSALTAEDIRKRVRQAPSGAQLHVVEGAGGLLVPVVGNYTFADLVADTAARVIVVVGSRLGAINHALLTFETIAYRKLPCIGYVLNDVYRFDAVEREYAQAIETNRGLLLELAKDYDVKELAYLRWCESKRVKTVSADPAITLLADEIISYFKL